MLPGSTTTQEHRMYKATWKGRKLHEIFFCRIFLRNMVLLDQPISEIIKGYTLPYSFDSELSRCNQIYHDNSLHY